MKTLSSDCPYSRKCGGCSYRELSYAEQLEKKQGHVIYLLKEFGKVEPIIGMSSPFHYRNKVHAAFTYDKGKTISGIYQPGSHAIVPVERCLIEDEQSDEIIQFIRGMLPRFKIPAFSEKNGSGWLRHVLIRRGFATGQIMVVLVAVNSIFKSQNNFIKALREQFPAIATVVLNVNDRFTPVVLGEKDKVLYGPGYIEDILCGKRFRISAHSFYQVNPVQTEVLYQTAIDFAGLTGKETVLDAYCGIGTIGIAASDGAKQVIGVEINRDAVRDAITNAKANGLKNCWFTCADASDYMLQLAKDKVPIDVAFMDPPRAGSTETFLSSLAAMAPKKIVYVSCNPETLQRDLQSLTKKNYRVEKIQPVDMFPYTEHVETVVCLGGKK